MNTKVRDLQCPGQNVPPQPTSAPTTPPSVSQDTPAPVQAADTPDGTILELGQSWRKNGIVLTLGNVNFRPQPDWEVCYISLQFSLENDTAQSRIITVKHNQFDITDNLGATNIRYGISSYAYPCPAPDATESFSQEVKPGETLPKSGFWYVGVNDNITNPSLEYIIVTVKELSEIRNAQWKIKINH